MSFSLWTCDRAFASSPANITDLVVVSAFWEEDLSSAVAKQPVHTVISLSSTVTQVSKTTFGPFGCWSVGFKRNKANLVHNFADRERRI